MFTGYLTPKTQHVPVAAADTQSAALIHWIAITNTVSTNDALAMKLVSLCI